MSAVTLMHILLAGFQTSSDADKRTEQLRSSLGFRAKNRVARLAIGRSLSESSDPPGSSDGAGKSIKGDVLFGVEELPLWVGLLFTHLRRVDPRAELTLSTLQASDCTHLTAPGFPWRSPVRQRSRPRAACRSITSSRRARHRTCAPESRPAWQPSG
ncbi:DUF1832 domain-containing protein [Verminephrobacter eiseniae]|nr:DUF1832 domain-containing protein [Verminephrobacter eiseniae]